MARTPIQDKINIEELAKMFDLSSWDEIDERNRDNIWETGDYAYKNALSDGDSEEKAEKAREDAEGEAGHDLYKNWHDGVMAAADALFGEHGLELAPIKSRGNDRPFEYRIAPTESWDAALKQIIETINGVGMFHFSSRREFLDSGPYATARIGVLRHVHHISSYPEVYGGTSAARYFEQGFR